MVLLPTSQTVVSNQCGRLKKEKWRGVECSCPFLKRPRSAMQCECASGRRDRRAALGKLRQPKRAFRVPEKFGAVFGDRFLFRLRLNLRGSSQEQWDEAPA
jgi:hypothetical protein